MVTYKLITGFSGYRVGDDGSVWSCRSRNGRGPFGRWRRKRCKPSARGYVRVSLMRDSKLHLVCVHRLVLQEFVGPCPPGCQACHNDGDPTNNRLTNLRWATPKENQGDRVFHGTHSRGDRNGRAKLSRRKVARMRARFARGGISKSELGRQNGVSGVMAGLIVRGKNWK